MFYEFKFLVLSLPTLRTHDNKEETGEVVRFPGRGFKRQEKQSEEHNVSWHIARFPCRVFFPPPRKVSRILSPFNKNLEGKVDIIPRTVKPLCAWSSLECFSHIPSRSQPTMWQVLEARKGGGNLSGAAGRLPEARGRRSPSSSRPQAGPLLLPQGKRRRDLHLKRQELTNCRNPKMPSANSYLWGQIEVKRIT